MRELAYALGDDAPSRQDLRKVIKALCRTGELVRVERDLYTLAGHQGRAFAGKLHFSRGNFFVHTDNEVIHVPPGSLGAAISGDEVAGTVTVEASPPLGEIERVTKKNAPRVVTVQVSRFRGMFVGDSEALGEPVQIVGGLPESVRAGSFTKVEIFDRKPFQRGAATGFPSHTLVAKHVARAAEEVEEPATRPTARKTVRTSVRATARAAAAAAETETETYGDAEVVPTGPQEPRARMEKQHMLRYVDPDAPNARTMLDQLAQGLGVDIPFEPDVLAQANAGTAPKTFTESGDDLSGIAFATIDGADAKDFDDAVFAEETSDGGLDLWVAIADVSHYVPEDSVLDIEARRRGCSVYLPGRVYPMLPPHLSDGVCSLRPNELRRCSYVRMKLDTEGAVVDYQVGFGVMRSRARLTYQQVQEYLDGGSLDAPREVQASVDVLEKLRIRRHAFRRTRGMLELDLPQPKVELSADGTTVEAVEPSPRWAANRLIEESALLANETIAMFLLREGWPTIYRVHGEPDPSKVGAIRHVLNDVARDARMPADPSPRDLERVLEKVAGTEASRVLSWLVLRVLPRAEYAVQRSVHFGLGTDLYLHFTSPIRRYPDLEVHRMVRRALEARRAATEEERGLLISRLTESASMANAGEAVQTQGERTSDRMMRALYMEPHVGEEFDALISDVARFGMFVSVTHPYVEGLVPIQTLGREFFEYDDRRSRLVGTRTRTVFQVGGTVRVRCVAVDVRQGNVNFELAEPVGGAPRARSDRDSRGGRAYKGSKPNKGGSRSGAPKGKGGHKSGGKAESTGSKAGKKPGKSHKKRR